MILTEEELNRIEHTLQQLAQNVTSQAWISEIVNSHRELFKANAELSFKKEIFKRAVEDIVVAVDFTDAETVRTLAFKALEDAKCTTP